MSTTETAAPPPPLGVAVMLWLAIIVALVAYLALGATLGLVPAYGGLVYVWFWANVDKMSFRAMPASLTGAVAGTATAAALQYGTVTNNATLGYVVLAGIAVALLLQILGKLSFVINTSFMLFLTIACAPLLLAGERFLPMIGGIVLSAAFFGAVVWLGQRMFAAKAAAAPAATPAEA